MESRILQLIAALRASGTGRSLILQEGKITLLRAELQPMLSMFEAQQFHQRVVRSLFGMP